MPFRLIVAVLAICMAPIARAETDPAALVTGFHETLIDVMKRADELGVEGRFTALSGPIDRTFHLPLTARQSAGRRAWRKASAEQQDALLAAFRHWTISSYASQFAAYGGEKFHTEGQAPGPRDGVVLVKTGLTIPDAPPVAFTYVMVKQSGRWGVYDVLVKRGTTSISQLAKHISEFKSVVRDGLPALTAVLQAKSRELLRDGQR